MNGTLILVGGYWRASKDLLTQVDKDLAPEDRGVDYVIRFKNLPDEFLAVEMIPTDKYHCVTCNAPVPEREVEQKIGCFVNHKLRRDVIQVPNYQRGFLDRTPDGLGKKRPQIKDAYRLELAHPRGSEIVDKIFDYVKRTYKPGEKVPNPIATGTRSAWMIDSASDIPTWELPAVSEEKADGKPDANGGIQCPHCDKFCENGEKALRMHTMKVHPEIYEKKYGKA